MLWSKPSYCSSIVVLQLSKLFFIHLQSFSHQHFFFFFYIFLLICCFWWRKSFSQHDLATAVFHCGDGAFKAFLHIGQMLQSTICIRVTFSSAKSKNVFMDYIYNNMLNWKSFARTIETRCVPTNRASRGNINPFQGDHKPPRSEASRGRMTPVFPLPSFSVAVRSSLAFITINTLFIVQKRKKKNV